MKKRILIRGVNWLGDAIMSTPAMMAIRQNHPDASIIMVSHAKLKGLWKHHPAVDEVISFTREEGFFSLVKQIKAARADIAVVFPNSTRSALEVWKAGIKTRIGYGGRLRSLFLTDVVKRPAQPAMKKRTEAEIKALAQTNQPRSTYPREAHHAFDYLHLVQPTFGPATSSKPVLQVTGEELAAFRAKFHIPGDQLVLGLNPGAEYGPAKRWPADRFIKAATELHKLTHCTWILFGGKADQPLTGEIEGTLKEAKVPAINVAGRTSLRELCAGLKTCRLVLTNDTGPMHVAAALDVPVIVPFGSTSPELTGPGDPAAPSSGLILGQAPCAPCFQRKCPIDFRCMLSIEPDHVVAEAIRQLGFSENQR